MALDHEIDVLGARQDMAQQAMMRRAARRMKLIVLFNTVRAYRALFLDEQGEIRPEAVTVIGDLATKGRLGVVDDPGSSDGALREYAGRRAIVLHLLARLDLSGMRLRDLARKMREAENE